jgi:hypothetical protein
VKALFPTAGTLLSALLAAMLFHVHSKPAAVFRGDVVGNVRVQFLSPSLVRLELKGPSGFEDRTTFTVVKRPKPLGGVERSERNGATIFRRGAIEVDIPDPSTLRGVTILNAGKEMYRCDGTAPKADFFPGPSEPPRVIALADSPRIIPSKLGARPAPAGNRIRKQTSGWDLTNQSLDVYVFLPSDYRSFRKEFLALTGPIPLPP